MKKLLVVAYAAAILFALESAAFGGERDRDHDGHGRRPGYCIPAPTTTVSATTSTTTTTAPPAGPFVCPAPAPAECATPDAVAALAAAVDTLWAEVASHSVLRSCRLRPNGVLRCGRTYLVPAGQVVVP